MSRATTRQIDGEKLRYEMNRRDLKLANVSIELGHKSDYMTGIIKSGKLTDATAVMLERLYNIRMEDIRIPAYETPEQIPGQTAFDLNTNQISEKKLEQIIYSALMRAYDDIKRGDGNNDGTEDQSDRIA